MTIRECVAYGSMWRLPGVCSVFVRMIFALLLVIGITTTAIVPSVHAQQRPGTLTSVQLGIDIRPETVTVGQHFIATIRIRAPQGTTIKFPEGTTTPANVDTAGPSRRRDTTMGGYVESTIAYRLAAWRTGNQRLGLDDIIVSSQTADRHVSLANAAVFVRSVLPADTTLRKPKPARPPFDIRVFNWLPWLIGAAAILALLAIWWFWRRWRQRPIPGLAALPWAEREFRRIEAMKLLERNAPEQHAILMVGVVRGYLEREFPSVPMWATTRELVAPLRALPVIPLEQTLHLFERTDLLKFAGAGIAPEESRQLGNESKSLVQRIEAQRREARAQAASEAVRNTTSQSEAA